MAAARGAGDIPPFHFAAWTDGEAADRAGCFLAVTADGGFALSAAAPPTAWRARLLGAAVGGSAPALELTMGVVAAAVGATGVSPAPAFSVLPGGQTEMRAGRVVLLRASAEAAGADVLCAPTSGDLCRFAPLGSANAVLLLSPEFEGDGLAGAVLSPPFAISSAADDKTAAVLRALTAMPLPLAFAGVLGAGKRGKVTAVSAAIDGSDDKLHFALKEQPWDARAAAELEVSRRSMAWRCLPLAPILALARDGGTAFTLMRRLGVELSFCVTPARRFPDLAALVALARRIAAAVGALHLRRYLHCDLHPGNVLVCSRAAGAGGDGASEWDPDTATLVDLGSAVQCGGDGVYRGPTRGGLWSVMSPEQFGPDKWATGSVVLTPASDVYALCALLAWCSTGGGSLPFHPLPATACGAGGKPPAVTVSGCLHAHPRRKWTADQWADWIDASRLGAPPLPRSWGVALGQGLRWDPAERPQSPDELLLALAKAMPAG